MWKLRRGLSCQQRYTPSQLSRYYNTSACAGAVLAHGRQAARRAMAGQPTLERKQSTMPKPKKKVSRSLCSRGGWGVQGRLAQRGEGGLPGRPRAGGERRRALPVGQCTVALHRQPIYASSRRTVTCVHGARVMTCRVPVGGCLSRREGSDWSYAWAVVSCALARLLLSCEQEGASERRWRRWDLVSVRLPPCACCSWP